MRLGTFIAVGLAGLALAACAHEGGDGRYHSGGSAHRASAADHATLIDWDGRLIRSGSNGWTCLPDNSYTAEDDPWCIYGAWDDFLSVFTRFNDPGTETVGVAYMRAGNPHVTHIDRSKAKFRVSGNWKPGPGDYLMAVPPPGHTPQAYPTDPSGGGAWMMWPGTPFEHVMIPRTASR
jgi:hypothetical protein